MLGGSGDVGDAELRAPSRLPGSCVGASPCEPPSCGQRGYRAKRVPRCADDADAARIRCGDDAYDDAESPSRRRRDGAGDGAELPPDATGDDADEALPLRLYADDGAEALPLLWNDDGDDDSR